MVDRINKGCIYYPCHNKNKLQDCTFCYCPFYPCQGEILGSKGKIKTLSSGEKIWDCSKCTVYHNRIKVNEIFRFLKNNWE